jgi:hypothetical protein
VTKDAGDDPDVTHGAIVGALVRPGRPGSGVTFAAGPGVGTVTRPGLPRLGIFWASGWVFSGCLWLTGAVTTTPSMPLTASSSMSRPTPADGEVPGEDLRPLLRRGLPVHAAAIPERLLRLPGVRARAVSDEHASRVVAFEALLRTLLARFPDQRLAGAARALFGLPPGVAGTTLTTRREAAAMVCGRESHHFRKHLEPRILDQLAAAMTADSDALAAGQAVAPVLLPAGAPTVLPAEVFAWEVTEHAEALSRLWSGVYALRAELLACQRLASMDPGGAAVAAAAGRALWRTAGLQAQVGDYRQTYGDRLLHAPMPPAALVALAGWAPPLSPWQIELLCQQAGDSPTAEEFTRRLTATGQGEQLHQQWVAAFATGDQGDTQHTQDQDHIQDQEKTSW